MVAFRSPHIGGTKCQARSSWSRWPRLRRGRHPLPSSIHVWGTISLQHGISGSSKPTSQLPAVIRCVGPAPRA